MVVVSLDDFVGRYEVTVPSFPDKVTALKDFMSSEEKRIMCDLMGIKMYNDYVSNPATYSGLTSEIWIKRGCGRTYYSKSLKDTLLKLIYLKVQKSNYVVSTENGRIRKDMENGTVLNPYVRDTNMYNRAVEAWRAIQHYSRYHYDKFDGIDKPFKFY